MRYKTILSLILFSFVLFSCSNDDDGRSVTGTWKATAYGVSTGTEIEFIPIETFGNCPHKFIFTAEGQFTRLDYGGENCQTTSAVTEFGEYSLQGTNLTLDDETGILLSLNATEMRIDFPDGPTVAYQKIE